MEWDNVLEAKVSEVETDDALLERLYAFFFHKELPQSIEEGPPQLQESGGLFHVLHLLRGVMRVKGLDAQAAVEELRELHSQHESTAVHAGTPEGDLVEQMVRLEKDIRLKDDTIERLKQQIGTSSPSVMASEARHLRAEVDDLNHELAELRRSVGEERSDNEKLMKNASAERLKSRRMERDLDALRHNLEDYKRQLDWQREQGRGTAARGTIEADFREKMRKKDMELAQQLDKIEELLNHRDDLEQQLREVTVQLGQVEKQRLEALKDTQTAQSALVQSDLHCDELEAKNKVLKGKLSDLQEQLTQHSGVDDHIVTLVNSKAKEWEGILSEKDAELAEYREKVEKLQGQLKAVEQHSSRATLVNMKKELQRRETELAALQSELSEATAHISTLSSELEQAQGKIDPSPLNEALKMELERAKANMKSLERDTKVEVQRREHAELEKEEKDADLTRALSRLREYERGEYGLHEAVMEIKVKKEELAIRDKDIAELTQHINHLDSELNRFSEENETLRDRLCLGRGEVVDVSGVRGRREREMEKLHKDNAILEREVERLEEDKLNLRKQLLGHRSSPAHIDHGTPDHTHSSEEQLLKIGELERACQEERRGKKACLGEIETLTKQLAVAKEKLHQHKLVVKEFRKGKEFKSESLDRLIALLEVEGSGDNMALTLQLKSQISELMGQREMLTQQLQRCEEEGRHALRELERKQYQIEELSKEVSIHRKLQSGYRPLPLPEEMALSSSDVIASLNEQLVRSLQQLRSRDEALEDARGALEKMQRKFSVILHQQGILYTEYNEGRGKWEEDKERRKAEKEKLLVEREQDKIKIQELEHLQNSLSGGEDEIRKRLGKMSQKLTVLQVNEKVLVRKQQLLQEGEATLKKENSHLYRDKLLIEKAVTEKMAYLQRHKETSLFKLASLQQELANTVPCSELERANLQYNQLAVTYQKVLSQQTAYTATAATLEQQKVELRTLSNQLEEVKQDLLIEKQKNRLLERKEVGGAVRLGQEGVGKEQRRSDQIATLEIKILNEKQRAELYSVRYQQLQETTAELEKRNVLLEVKFTDLVQKLLQAQVREGELRDEIATSLPKSEQLVLEEQITRLKNSEARLKIENSRLKEVAEVARQQAVAVEVIQKSHDLEVGSLHQQLLDLQSGSDERTAAGRLHHQILGAQVGEASARKKLEAAEAKIIHLEACLLRSEQERGRSHEAVFQSRAESIIRVKHLRATIQSLRRQYSGAIPLSECERHAHLLHQAREDRKEAEKLKEEARQERDQAQEKVLELGLQQSNLEELISALRDSSPDHTPTRLTEWHAKLGELRLIELRTTRANQKLTDKVQHLEGVVRASEISLSKLEQDLVSVTKEKEAALLSWEQREAQLEKQLESYSIAAKITSPMNFDPKLSSCMDMQEALTRLQESLRERALLTQRAEEKEKEAGHLETALRGMKAELIERESEIIQLRGEMERRKIATQVESTERDEDEKALKSAINTAKELNAQLLAKDEAVEKYQRMLQETRNELQAKISAHKDEVTSLREKLVSRDDSAFSQLKLASLAVVNTPPPLVPTDRQLQRLAELEEASVQVEVEGKRLAQQVEVERHEKESLEKAYEARIAKIKIESKELTQQYRQEMNELRETLSEKSLRVNELEQEVEVMEGELSAAQQAAKQGPSRTMKALVERLRNQLHVKEKQQRALSEALLQVRADLVETAEKTLMGESAKEEQEGNIHHLVEHRTSQLQVQIRDLTSMLDEVKGQLSECEVKGTEEISKLKRERESLASSLRSELEERESLAKAHREELSEKDASIKKLEADIVKKKHSLEQARHKEHRLIEQLKAQSELSKDQPQVVELHKRLKVMQGKLDKQREQVKGLEVALKAAQHKPHPSGIDGGTPLKGEGPMAVNTEKQPPTIDHKHQAMEVIRWEEGKKWQKKLDLLRNKLSERNKELEVAHKQITSLKETQNRNDREKNMMSAKVKTLQKQVDDAVGNLGGHSTGESRGLTAGGHNIEEMERVVTAMRKVIEKLQVEKEGLKEENEGLNRNSKTWQEKGGGALSALQEENKKLKAQMELHKMPVGMVTGGVARPSSSKSPYTKIVAENERLRKDLKKEVEKSDRLQLTLSTLQKHHDKLNQEVEGLNKTTPLSASYDLEVKVEVLQAEVEKKTAMLMEVKRHLKEAAERERELKQISTDPHLSEKYLLVVGERDDLKKETAQLRVELDAFDHTFFEEIEDLKFNYQQAVARNVELEDQISREHGVSFSSDPHPPTI